MQSLTAVTSVITIQENTVMLNEKESFYLRNWAGISYSWK